MFSIGDLIVYGETGVCRVEDITTRTDGAARRRYYVLQPLYQDCMISAPADSDKIFMRPVISKGEADRLIDRIPSVSAEAYYSRALRELTEHYEAAIRAHNCGELLRLTMSLHAKKCDAERQKRKFGAVDERYMKRAEELLFGEFAAALGIPRDGVRDYIARRVKRPAGGGA